jgi:hypothetical protein
MGRRETLFTALLVSVAVFFLAGNAFAGGRARTSPICAGCHKADSDTIWGTLVPGTQTDDSFKVQAGKDVWSVRYDKGTKLEKLFKSVRELRDEKAVRVKFEDEGAGVVYAEEVSHKPNYKFKDPDDVITIAEVIELLKKDPKEGNYVIFDARGYDNYIEGHLPHAVLLPYYRLQAFKDRLPADKDTLIVAYCRGYG